MGPMIYQADVRVENVTKKYIGSAGNTFKERYYGHTSNLEHENTNGTTLSSYVWAKRNKGKMPKITWNTKAKTSVYSAGAKFCDCCLTEKTLIMLSNPLEYLNQRTEILNKCRHMAKYTLQNF